MATVQHAPPCRVALGFDFGRARIGVAVGESITGAARPLRTLPARQQRPDWDAIARLIREWRPDWLVVGVPRHADDTASAMTEATLRFSRQLHGRFHLPVATLDERLSSWEAGQRQIETAKTQRCEQRDGVCVAFQPRATARQQQERARSKHRMFGMEAFAPRR